MEVGEAEGEEACEDGGGWWEMGAAPDGWVRSLLLSRVVMERFRDGILWGWVCARSMTSAPPTKKMSLMAGSWRCEDGDEESMQEREARRKRRERRRRISEVAAGDEPWTSRCRQSRAQGRPANRSSTPLRSQEMHAFSRAGLAEYPMPAPWSSAFSGRRGAAEEGGDRGERRGSGGEGKDYVRPCFASVHACMV